MPVVESRAFVGRKTEYEALEKALNDALDSRGSTHILKGEPGIGKSRLVAEFRKLAEDRGIGIHTGAGLMELAQPFQVFSAALSDATDRVLFKEESHARFLKIFAVDRSGLLIAESTSEDGEIDSDIFAGMLTAVQNFVKDSFSMSGGAEDASLGRLEYGDMKILTENGSHMFLTAIIQGQEHEEMGASLRRAVKEIETRHGQSLESWSGDTKSVQPVLDMIDALALEKFLVKRSLEGLDLRRERNRISALTYEVLTEMAIERPLLLILEDLHWADESSLFVLRFLARNIAAENIMMLCTARPGESPSFEEALAGMVDEDTVSVTELKRLGSEDISSLISELYSPNKFPDNFISQLSDRSAGNPFFLLETLRHIEDTGQIFNDEGTYALASHDISIPETVEDVVQERLGTLDMEPLAMAEYLACVGGVCTDGMLERLDAVADHQLAISALMDSNIIVPSDDGYDFSHAILRDVIYSGISPRWKGNYHLILGNYFEEAYADSIHDVLYELARHFYKSREHSKALDYCVRAGEKAEASFAPEQAVEFYEHALELSRQHSPGQRILLLERLGDLGSLLGNFKVGLEYLSSALDWVDDPVTKARYLRKSADIYEKLGEYDRKLEVLAEAKDVLGDVQDIEEVRIMLGMANTHRRRGDFDLALEILSDATGMLQNFPDSKRETQEIYNLMGLIDWRRGELYEALAYMQKAHDLAVEINDERLIARAESNLGNVYNLKGEPHEAMKMYKSCLERFKKLGDIQYMTISYNNIGNIHSDTGDLESALEYYMKCLEIRKRIGDRKGLAYTMNNIGNQLKFRGQYAEALEYCQQCYENLKAIGDRVALPIVINNMADCYRYLGQIEKAKEYHKESLELCRETDNRKPEVTTMCDLAEIALEEGKSDEALEIINEGLEISESMSARFEIAVCNRVRGMIFRDQGKHQEAMQEFGKAMEIFESMDDKRDTARLHYEAGLLLRDMGKDEEARAEVIKAKELFESIGMRTWVEDCNTFLETA